MKSLERQHRNNRNQGSFSTQWGYHTARADYQRSQEESQEEDSSARIGDEDMTLVALSYRQVSALYQQFQSSNGKSSLNNQIQHGPSRMTREKLAAVLNDTIALIDDDIDGL